MASIFASAINVFARSMRPSRSSLVNGRARFRIGCNAAIDAGTAGDVDVVLLWALARGDHMTPATSDDSRNTDRLDSMSNSPFAEGAASIGNLEDTGRSRTIRPVLSRAELTV